MDSDAKTAGRVPRDFESLRSTIIERKGKHAEAACAGRGLCARQSR